MKKRLFLLFALALLIAPTVVMWAQESSTPAAASTTASYGGFDLIWLTLTGSVVALTFAGSLIWRTMKKDPGPKEMREISDAVHTGAMAYIRQQYKVVAMFFVVLFVVLGFIAWIVPMMNGGQRLLSRYVPVAFLTGGFFSALSGFIGMKVATKANCRTAFAASKSLNAGLRVAFNSGTVMGMVVVGLGLLDLSLWWILLRYVFLPLGWGINSAAEIPPIMITFGMGASSAALFARLGGGIYTKAADVGADLVGKVEAGIPEDDPRNPATIADNVGDNVGDVAGMGADLYESYVGSVVATMALGSAAAALMGLGEKALLFIQLPAFIAVIGVIASIIGTFLVRSKEDATQKTLLRALRTGVWSSTGLIAVASFFAIYFLLPGQLGLWGSVAVGLVAGLIISVSTEYFTSDTYKPTKNLAQATTTGPATLIIGGLSLGMLSTAIPVVTVVLGTLGAFYFADGLHSAVTGLYGIGLAAVGMLSTLGITLATDAYGPVADNAGGIAEMTHQAPEVRRRTDALDSLGNTTAATGKGFAIGSAALTALALIAEYGQKIADFSKITFENVVANILNPAVLVGLMLGVTLPFVFAAMAMGAVGRAAQAMVDEVRRQFKAKPGILQGTDKPDYASCVKISTMGAQREMVLPSLMAVTVPIIVGFLFGPYTVLALLAGATASGFVLAIMMANSGGAWDNAKKHIEAGNLGGKGSPAHKAAVVGDTVGDPFKDTSGPCLNILIKLMSMVSIVFVGTCIAVNNGFIGLLSSIFGIK
jgi:K(+)-stimulated pyrophosphate-energized sodium pump